MKTFDVCDAITLFFFFFLNDYRFLDNVKIN